MAGRSIVTRLGEVIEQARNVGLAVRQRTYDDSIRDWILRLAIERGLEIISEASRHMRDEDKRRIPEVPWPKISAIGNVLRHEYDRTDPEVVWSAATEHVPRLEPILA
jgi:uncharacterized protein with HEPN domain